jgi:hypothetical protein
MLEKRSLLCRSYIHTYIALMFVYHRRKSTVTKLIALQVAYSALESENIFTISG